MHCAPETIALLALGEADGFDQDLAHVRECAQCQLELDQLARVVRTGRSITRDDIPAAAPEEVWQAIVRELNARSVGADDLAVRRARRSTLPWIGVAAAAGLVIGGLGTGQFLESADSGSVVASVTLDPLPGNSIIGDAAVAETDQGTVLSISVPNLPAPDGYYEVWLLKPDVSNMISIGVLNGNNQGTFPLPPNLDLSEFSVVDISREKFDGDATHSNDSVVRGSFPA